MSISLPITEQQEISADVAVDLGLARHPQYGRYLDELDPGQVFEHPRGFTFDTSNMLDFARTYMQANPLYLNAHYAKAHGFADLLAVLSNWGCTDCPEDIDGSGVADFLDLLEVLSNWGPCP